jgi:hypothetical protein
LSLREEVRIQSGTVDYNTSQSNKKRLQDRRETDAEIHSLPIPSSLCCVLGVFGTDNGLGNSIGRCGFDHQLEVAMLVEESEQVHAFVNSFANLIDEMKEANILEKELDVRVNRPWFWRMHALFLGPRAAAMLWPSSAARTTPP